MGVKWLFSPIESTLSHQENLPDAPIPLRSIRRKHPNNATAVVCALRLYGRTKTLSPARTSAPQCSGASFA